MFISIFITIYTNWLRCSFLSLFIIWR